MPASHETIMHRLRWLARACAGVLVFGATMAVALPAHASVYDPLNVISYETWRASSSMTATDIQTFLNTQSGPLKSYVCTDTITGTTPVARSAASIIWRSAQAWNLNPKVILATLQKEQSLLTTSNSSNASRLNKAMGCGVYTNSPNTYPGFANQVYNGARLLAGYEKTYGWTPGMAKKVTVSATGKSATIAPANSCTFALYTYTPYYPQQLFWNVYVTYFGDPLAGALPKVSLTAVATSYTSVKLSWPSVSGATGYEIWRATSSSGTYTKISTTAGTSTSYSNTSLTAGVTYYYTVRALKTAGGATTNGPCSDVQHAVPLPAKDTLSYTAGANGTLSGVAAQTVSSGGSGSSITAVPNSGYRFVSWNDGVTTATRQDTHVASNISVTANFAISTCALSPSAGANGTISPATAQTVNCGDSMTFTIAPATGYHIAGVLVDGVSNAGAIASGSYTFTDVQAAHTIAATFAANALTKLPTTLTITSNKTTVARGQTITFSGTIAPNTGNGSLVRVYIRNSASSTWMLSSVRSTFSSGHWSYSYKISTGHARGTYYAQARYSESSRYLASVSASRAFVIK